MNLQGEFFGKGYNTGVVDTDEHRDAPHDAGPLPLEFVRLSQMAVEAGVQQADNSCERRSKQTQITQDKQKFWETPAGESCHGAAVCGIILFAEHVLP